MNYETRKNVFERQNIENIGTMNCFSSNFKQLLFIEISTFGIFRFFRRKPKYTAENLVKALSNVRSGKLSIRKAQQKYKVPKSVIHRNLNVNFALNGPPTVLSKEEEDDIVKWIFDFSSRGFPITKSQLISCVQLMLNTQSRVTKFVDNRPGRSWLKSFMNRNKSISVRLVQNINRSRAAVTEELIRDWFKEVK